MNPAPGPHSDPVDRRARHREVPGPLEARWVPALLVCLTLGILGVAWDAPARSAAALTGLAVAAAAVLGVARSTGRIRGVATATALAGVAAALMLQHSAGPAAAAEGSGWTGAVHAGSPLRLELTLDGPATRSEAAFGPRWSVPVRVETFGHPPRAPEAAVTARLTGGGAPPATIAAPSDGTAAPGGGPGSRVCVVARPSRSGSTVFLAAAAAPQPGPCPGGVQTAGGVADGDPRPPRRARVAVGDSACRLHPAGAGSRLRGGRGGQEHGGAGPRRPGHDAHPRSRPAAGGRRSVRRRGDRRGRCAPARESGRHGRLGGPRRMTERLDPHGHAPARAEGRLAPGGGPVQGQLEPQR